MNCPECYELLETRELKEIGGTGHELKHKKSGARLFVIETDDDNKVFYVAFRTPPKDDTGVFHILEHAVLEGSERYPVKDPMGELTGSLRTFMNAMTFEDRTVFPVASTNLSSFQNLMAVYTDAVFSPLLTASPLSFYQEGWHYEYEEEEDELSVNGIVYNEMRGAHSDPDSLLEQKIRKSLFPDTCYAYDAGGDPEHIPELSYEAFLQAYRTYYHPSNAYLYLYGDMDMEERLTWLDREYLSRFEQGEAAEKSCTQTPFAAVREERLLTDCGDNDPETSYSFAWAKAVGGLTDTLSALAFEVLEYALIDASGAPVREALLKAGICEEVWGGYVDEIAEPYFEIVAKGCRREDRQAFLRIVEETLRETVRQGLPEKTLLAAVNNIEFTVREAEYSMPKGLTYGLDALSSWVYDLSPMLFLSFEDDLKRIRELVGTGWFERLITEKLLENPFGVFVTSVPVPGLNEEKDDALADRLETLKNSLSEEEKNKLLQENEALCTWQEEEETEDKLKTIPVLKREDISRKIRPFINEKLRYEGVDILFHEIRNKGIGYADLIFPTAYIEEEDLPYLMIVKGLLSLLSTKQTDYTEIFDRVLLSTGGFRANFTVYEVGEEMKPDERLVIRFKYLLGKEEEASELLSEILLDTDFSDTDRIEMLLSERRSEMREELLESGSASALKRVFSVSSQAGAIDEKLSGITFFRFLDELLTHFDERKEELKLKLKETLIKALNQQEMLVSFTGSREALEAFLPAVKKLADRLPKLSEKSKKKPNRSYDSFCPAQISEGVRTSSLIQHIALGGHLNKQKYPWTGAYYVLRSWLVNEALWDRIRVSGGAYGVSAIFRKNGDMALSSYRDPGLKSTVDTFLKVPEIIRNYPPDDRALMKAVVSAVNVQEAPLSDEAKGIRSLHFYLSGLSEEALQKEREELLSCSREDLLPLADALEEVLENASLCILGSKEKLKDAGELITQIMTISGE